MADPSKPIGVFLGGVHLSDGEVPPPEGDCEHPPHVAPDGRSDFGNVARKAADTLQALGEPHDRPSVAEGKSYWLNPILEAFERAMGILDTASARRSWQQVISVSSQALDGDAARGEAHLYKGYAAFELGRVDLAVEALSQALIFLENESDQALAYLTRGRAYSRQAEEKEGQGLPVEAKGLFEKAVTDFERASALVPDIPPEFLYEEEEDDLYEALDAIELALGEYRVTGTSFIRYQELQQILEESEPYPEMGGPRALLQSVSIPTSQTDAVALDLEAEQALVLLTGVLAYAQQRTSQPKASWFDRAYQNWIKEGELEIGSAPTLVAAGLALYCAQEGILLGQGGLTHFKVSYDHEEITLGVGAENIREFYRTGEMGSRSFHALSLGLYHYFLRYSRFSWARLWADRIAYVLDQVYGGRLNWDNSLHGLEHIGIARFEKLNPVLVAQAKLSGEIIYLVGGIVEKDGHIVGGVSLEQKIPEEKRNIKSGHFKVALRWDQYRWKVILSEGMGLRADKVLYALHKGGVVDLPQVQRSVSLVELKEEGANLIRKEAELFLSEKPAVGTRLILVSQFYNKFGVVKKEGSILLSRDLFREGIRPRGLALLLIWNGQDWVMSKYGGSSDCYVSKELALLQEAHVVTAVNPSDYLARVAPHSEERLSHLDPFKPLIKPIHDLLGGSLEPGEVFRHHLGLEEYDLFLYGQCVPPGKLPEAGEFVGDSVTWPRVTPDVPQPFLTLKIQSKTGQPLAFYVLFPTPEGNVFLKAETGNYFPTGNIGDLEQFFQNEIEQVNPVHETALFKEPSYRQVFAKLGGYYFREYYLQYHNLLEAFIATLETLQLIGEEKIKPSYLQSILTDLGYSFKYIDCNYDWYTFWKEQGVDVKAEYDEMVAAEIPYRPCIRTLLDRLRPLGAPSGSSYRGSLRFYLQSVLTDLDRSSTHNRHVPFAQNTFPLSEVHFVEVEDDSGEGGLDERLGEDQHELQVARLRQVLYSSLFTPAERHLLGQVMRGKDISLPDDLRKKFMQAMEVTSLDTDNEEADEEDDMDGLELAISERVQGTSYASLWDEVLPRLEEVDVDPSVGLAAMRWLKEAPNEELEVRLQLLQKNGTRIDPQTPELPPDERVYLVEIKGGSGWGRKVVTVLTYQIRGQGEKVLVIRKGELFEEEKGRAMRLGYTVVEWEGKEEINGRERSFLEKDIKESLGLRAGIEREGIKLIWGQEFWEAHGRAREVRSYTFTEEKPPKDLARRGIREEEAGVEAEAEKDSRGDHRGGILGVISGGSSEGPIQGARVYGEGLSQPGQIPSQGIVNGIQGVIPLPSPQVLPGLAPSVINPNSMERAVPVAVPAPVPAP